MIPTFPNFKNIEWSDRSEVEQFTKEFLPYSDFNFVSIWSWNTREKMRISQLHENLIVLFYDYMTEEPFLTFIGRQRLTETALSLLEYSKQKFNVETLKLIPEAVAAELPEELFITTGDENAHDYVIAVSYTTKLDTLPNSQLGAYACKRFLRMYPQYTSKVCPANEARKEDYICLFKGWAKTKSLNHGELNEYSAFERFINNPESGNFIVSLYDAEKLIGFVTYEIVSTQYAILHFGKAEQSYKGIYEFMLFTMSKALEKHNIEYWNFEQDLGIPGLRMSKRDANPSFYLKKYTVALKGKEVICN